MQTVKIKNLEIGKGIPKICIPLTGKTTEEILTELEEVKKKKPDLIEWRADCYENGKDGKKVQEMLRTINDKIGENPLLFTFRTRGEGGEQELPFPDYVKLLIQAAKTGLADLIDVEVFFEERSSKKLIEELHFAGARVVASNHDFQKTPDKEEIVRRLTAMQRYGGDILKIALMPQERKDLYLLLEATSEAEEKTCCPIVTMSMGKIGMLSRICGEISGSCITFASGVRASAPGQISAEKVRDILNKIHEIQADGT